jgi:hypothetical protein
MGFAGNASAGFEQAWRYSDFKGSEELYLGRFQYSHSLYVWAAHLFTDH